MLKWGSLEKVELEKEVRETDTDEAHFPIYKRYLLEKYREVGNLAQLVEVWKYHYSEATTER